MAVYEELISALEAGEISHFEWTQAKGIIFNINEEDISLFIQGSRDQLYLDDVFSVSYSDITSDYDGVYCVLMKDDSIRYYGWIDACSSTTLYRVYDIDR